MNALEIKDLQKNYGDFTLYPLDLVLPSGCVMGLVGENGAGKSTTIRLILGAAARDGGSVSILGTDSRECLPLAKDDIGVVLDEAGIPECLNAAQIGRVMRQIFSRWDDAEYARLTEKLSLPGKTPFHKLSRGMKKKLALAVAMSHGAKLLILDEPTDGLDPLARDELTELLLDFTRDENHSVLISSHILSDLEKICDYVAFLHRGRLLLCEEKDRIGEIFGVVHLTREEFAALPCSVAVAGSRDTGYGVEAVVRRDTLPRGIAVSPVDLEQLFIYMAKEENVHERTYS